jgi:hypothetical protein
VTLRNRRSRRKRIQASKNREKLKEFANASAKGAEWIVLFLGLLVSIAGRWSHSSLAQPSTRSCSSSSPCSWGRHS